MSVEELVAYLKAWTPTGDWRAATPDGLARELTKVVTSNGAEFAEYAESFIGLDPTYVRGVISGFEQASKQSDFEWRKVIPLLTWVVRRDDSIQQLTIDSDATWVWTKREVLRLLDDAFETGEQEAPLELRGDLWSILEPLTNHSDPTIEHEVEYGGSNMDPFTMSINTVRGNATHTLLRYALWLHRKLGLSSEAHGFEHMPEVRGVLERLVDPRKDESLAIRAALGHWVPWLELLDSGWLATHLDRVFPEDERQWAAAWYGYVVYTPAYNVMARTLYGQYLRATDYLSVGSDERRDSAEKLAEHLVAFYWRGIIELDDPLLQKFYRHGSLRIRQHAFGFIGRSLGSDDNTSEIPEQVAARLQQLLEWRIVTVMSGAPADKAELAPFTWSFASEAFDMNWSVEALQRILDLGVLPDVPSIIIKKLRTLDDQGAAIKALRSIVELDTNGWEISISRDDIAAVLTSAHTSSSPRVADDARELVNYLLTRGHMGYRTILEEPAG